MLTENLAWLGRACIYGALTVVEGGCKLLAMLPDKTSGKNESLSSFPGVYGGGMEGVDSFGNNCLFHEGDDGEMHSSPIP